VANAYDTYYMLPAQPHIYNCLLLLSPLTAAAAAPSALLPVLPIAAAQSLLQAAACHVPAWPKMVVTHPP